MNIRLYEFEEDVQQLSDDQYRSLCDELYEPLHEKAKLLTGDIWCPYPGLLFMAVILTIPEYGIAKGLIVERRKYLFIPHFIKGEPQERKLKALAEEYQLSLDVALLSS